MRSKVIAFTISFFSVTLVFAQERIWVKQTKLREVIAFEKQIDSSATFLSMNEGLSKDYYPLVDKYKVANPLIVKRLPFKYLPLYAEYFYTSEDSVLRVVSYDWEIERYGNFFDKQKMWRNESAKLKKYNSEYERIKAILIKQLGAPATSDPSDKEINDSGQKYLTRETTWENNLSKATLSMIFASSTYRIRFILYWKE
jgi:hypothetical protein